MFVPRIRGKPINKKRWFIRLYCLTMVTILLASIFSLITQSASARTYVITDGDRVITYNTFATDPAEVLGQAGVNLEETDSFTTADSAEGPAITVHRGRNITIHYHGDTMNVAGAGLTAGELLSRLGLEVTGEDMVSPGLETILEPGATVQVDRVQTRQETYTAPISHETTYYQDRSLPLGAEDVLVKGQDGELLRTALVTYVNGIEQGQQVLGETVTRHPVAQIVAVGANREGPPNKPIIRDGFIHRPTGEVLTYTGTDTVQATAYTHTDAGCDYITATGTKVRRGSVAVDPRYIPYGTRMFIQSATGSYVYGIAVAEDCGGAIKGDRMDLYLPTYEECLEFGRRTCTVYYLG